MRPIGFSTGALSKEGVLSGIHLQKRFGVSAVEVSALRIDELGPILDLMPCIEKELADTEFVSFHAPSALRSDDERATTVALAEAVPKEWPIVVHPDAISDFALWEPLASRLSIENMDQRKRRGRTVRELADVFLRLPDARFCFDMGHCHQVDPTMVESILMLKEFADRLTLIHVSQLDSQSHHVALGFATFQAFRYVMEFVPANCPVIIESVVDGMNIDRELTKVRVCFEASEPATLT
jgi:hypothetical protein